MGPWYFEESEFDGGLAEFIGINILSFLLIVVTLGIGLPWVMCMRERYTINHTIVNGQRLKFIGKGGNLFLHWLRWILFTIITLGIYGFLIGIRFRQWKAKNIVFD
ncbi:DUF898 family protein [Candidatus Arthromitus sp. SFB-rat-Yit]|uniref:DUF898 family protein n=1 Tax=Candidatus Arthromitus sp. SFB-rat-Yit TaxID=1041504 RepID=UPI000227A762|nr:DUF898 family protein [Candidatus Arthromitus sp. SFB-rat-Yit]BAK81146.1 hypothetical protein RATSFB_0584 [Candidatus Arthromitus sp. SFB-rat-Yit]